jgi:hypothetical protein
VVVTKASEAEVKTTDPIMVVKIKIKITTSMAGIKVRITIEEARDILETIVAITMAKDAEVIDKIGVEASAAAVVALTKMAAMGINMVDEDKGK